MRDEQHRAGERLERRLERLARLEVEVVRRLVEHEEVRAGRDHDREREPPPLAARERRRPASRARPSRRRGTARAASAPRAAAGRCRDRRVEHRAALVELGLVLREVRRLDAVAKPHAPGHRRPAAQDRLEQRRLARAVRADSATCSPRSIAKCVVEQLACRRPRASSPSATDDVAAASAAASGTRSRACAARARSGASHAVGLDPLDLLELRLRLARLRRLVAEALDEALEPGDLLGLARSAVFAACIARAACSRRQTCQAPGKNVDRPRSSSSTAVVTASRNQRSCATRITAASIVRSICSSHSSDSMSRWFVGSSSSSRSGCAASARASEARVSSPPEKV